MISIAIILAVNTEKKMHLTASLDTGQREEVVETE